MGLDINAARFLLAEKLRGIDFGRTLTLGRQAIYMSRDEYAAILANLNLPPSASEYAEDFYRGIGAHPLVTMDASSYESAEVIHDMNDLVDTKHHSAFDTVIDGGTLEHVFNFPTAIRNCMEMVKPGGQLILMTPWHNYPGHGFYQFSPELIHATLSAENGFRVDQMLTVAEGSWYAVRNPGDIKQRIEIFTTDPILLFVTATKLAAQPVFVRWPQQSDYSAAWQHIPNHPGPQAPNPGFLSRLSETNPWLQKLRFHWRSFKRRRIMSPKYNPGLVCLGPSNQIPVNGKTN